MVLLQNVWIYFVGNNQNHLNYASEFVIFCQKRVDFLLRNVSGQMRLNMFTLVKTLQESAAEVYFNRYRGMYSVVREVEILDYTTHVNFSQEANENRKVEEFYNTQQAEELSAVKDIGSYISWGVAVAFGVAAPFVSLLLLIGTGIGLALGVGMFISNRFKRKNIILRIQKQKSNVLEIIHKMFSEYEIFMKLYKERDDISEKIMEEFANL